MGLWLTVLAVLSATACSEDEAPPDPPPTEEPPPPTVNTKSYTNPLRATIPGGGLVENCPDPTIIRGQQPGDTAWYIYCTMDPLNAQDKDSEGKLKQHLIPTLKSMDLVEWTYAGDAFSAPPDWAQPGTDLWAPEIEYFGGKYHLYYSVVDTKAGGYAIGVATSEGPLGPWTHAAQPVVEPHEPPCCGGERRWTIDPEVITDAEGARYIYYGSYYGGVSVRRLSEDGLTSDPYTQVEVTVANRYEATSIIPHDGYYYLLASSTDCCVGPLTGYSVFAGRSRSPYGPFVDREGIRLTDARVGGTPVLGLNGNRWVGTGHTTVLTDSGGQQWLLYHAVDRDHPYLGTEPGQERFTQRFLLMDALDWVDGWPTVRGGLWASDTEQPAPATQPNEISRYKMVAAKEAEPGAAIASASDEFDGATLSGQWTWIRPPSANDFGLGQGGLRMNTQAADLHGGNNTASVLTEPVPSGDYLVETKLTLNLPPVSCCHNFVQAGLVIHGDDDHYVKLVHFSFWETRQIAFAKESPAPGPDLPFYGETFGGPATETVWLRIVRRAQGSQELYTAYSSINGTSWTRAGTWMHQLGPSARIGLVSMSGAGFTATFDYVRVYGLKE
ncbi:family 43 glycosylhydrolase [Stigmatella sp. ncwal1]|uniref:Family 43 glycosylhydrolase n=1 Tax=Stigmatella ashevillensis TaxID=2995309 RepID=A0ABT5D2C0_9BACT|nr:family 43 glycosylhydrolase [Stigmatella ashevillena]MDC0707706.1 family 43 glycosylhydrolase [Stigmatella ashevillena]